MRARHRAHCGSSGCMHARFFLRIRGSMAQNRECPLDGLTNSYREGLNLLLMHPKNQRVPSDGRSVSMASFQPECTVSGPSTCPPMKMAETERTRENAAPARKPGGGYAFWRNGRTKGSWRGRDLFISLTHPLTHSVCVPTADRRQFHPVVSCCSTRRSLFSGGEVDCGESPAWRVSPPEVFRPTGLEIKLRVVNRVPRSAHAKLYGPLVRRPNGVSQRVGRRQVPWPSKLITFVLNVPRLGYLGTANHIVFLSLNVHGGASRAWLDSGDGTANWPRRNFPF